MFRSDDISRLLIGFSSMFAFNINDDLSVTGVFNCRFNDYLNLLNTDPDLKWVSATGFLSPDSQSDFLNNPSRYIYIAGSSLWDGIIVDALARTTVTSYPLSSNSGLNGGDGGSITVPAGVTYFLVSNLVASGADASGTSNGGSGSYVSNIGFYVTPGQIITLSGLLGGRGTSSLDVASSAILSINGVVVLELGGGVGGNTANSNYPNGIIPNFPYSSPYAGAGGRWIRSPSETICTNGISGSAYPTQIPIPMPYGHGGMGSTIAGAGFINGTFSNVLPSGYSIYSISDTIYTNDEITATYSSNPSLNISQQGPLGFGLQTQDEHVGIYFRQLFSGDTVYTNGASVTSLYLRAPPGTTVGGFVGDGGYVDPDKPNASQPYAQDTWIYASYPIGSGKMSVPVPIVYLKGAPGQPDSTGVNSYSGEEIPSGSAGYWSVGIPNLPYNTVYQIADGNSISGYANAGIVTVTLVDQNYENNIIVPNNIPVFDITEYVASIRNRPSNVDPSWTVTFDGSSIGHHTLQTAGWENYVQVVYASSAGGAGSSAVAGGSGAMLAGPVYAIPPGSIISAYIGGGGKYNPNDNYQRNGDHLELKINGISVFDLAGGAGGATDPYTNAVNYSVDWERPQDKLFMLASQGGTWLSMLQGTPTPVSYFENIGITPNTSYGGKIASNGDPSKMQLVFHKNPPSGTTSIIQLSAQSISNPLPGLNDPNPVVQTQEYTTAGTYTITVPAGCYAMKVDDLIGAQGGGYMDIFLSGYMQQIWPPSFVLNTYPRKGFVFPPENYNKICKVYGGAGGRSQGSWTRVTPGQTIQVVVGAGGVGSTPPAQANPSDIGFGAPLKLEQPQGQASTVMVQDSSGTLHMAVGVDGGCGTPGTSGISTITSINGNKTYPIWSCNPSSSAYYNGGTQSFDPNISVVENPSSDEDAIYLYQNKPSDWGVTGKDGYAQVSFYNHVDVGMESNDPTIYGGTLYSNTPNVVLPSLFFVHQISSADPGYGNYTSGTNYNPPSYEGAMHNTFIVPQGYNSFQLLTAAGAGGPIVGRSGEQGGVLYFGSLVSGPAISCKEGDKITVDCVSVGNLTTDYIMTYTSADGSITNQLFRIAAPTANSAGKVVSTHPAYTAAKASMTGPFITRTPVWNGGAKDWGNVSYCAAVVRQATWGPWPGGYGINAAGYACTSRSLFSVPCVILSNNDGVSWGYDNSGTTAAGVVMVFSTDIATGSNTDPSAASVNW